MEKTLLSKEDIQRTLERLAYEILEKHGSKPENILLLGIQRRGVDLARRLAQILAERAKVDIPLGTLDINLYRDDWTSLSSIPAIGASHIPPLDAKSVILVDDVLYTGRTIRAALEAVLDYGRPSRVELLVLIDRGHRELPIHADYVGRKINTARKEKVNVLLEERDGIDEVRISQ